MMIHCESVPIGDNGVFRTHHSAEVYGDFMYVFGGTIARKSDAINELWKLDLSKEFFFLGRFVCGWI